MTRLFLLLGVVFTLPAIALQGQAPSDTATPPYKSARLSPEQRADDLLGRMTPEEKARPLLVRARLSVVEGPAQAADQVVLVRRPVVDETPGR
jgi:hypothetical protein